MCVCVCVRACVPACVHACVHVINLRFICTVISCHYSIFGRVVSKLITVSCHIQSSYKFGLVPLTAGRRSWGDFCLQVGEFGGKRPLDKWVR